MHNLKEIRKNFDAFEKELKKRTIDINFSQLKKLDIQNREFIQKKENLEKEKKEISKSKDKSLFAKSKELSVSLEEISKKQNVLKSELEKILYEAIPALDHGFVRVIDYMGDDTSIVQSARVSYGKGTKQVSTDKGLIKYLMRHWHSTPFEMCEIKYHIKLPIFIA